MFNKSILWALFSFNFLLLCSCSQNTEKEICDFRELSNVLEIVEETEQRTSEYLNSAKEERKKVRDIYEDNKLLLEQLAQERQKLEKATQEFKKARRGCGNLSAERLSKITPIRLSNKIKKAPAPAPVPPVKIQEISETKQPDIIDPPYSPSDAPI
jgi:cell division FtsZ-interacting protein ZapD